MPKRLRTPAQPLRQFFRAGHHESQAAEIFRRAARAIQLQKSRRREEKGDLVIAHRVAPTASASSGLGWKTTPMPEHGRQPERTVKPNEWKNGRMPSMQSRRLEA